MDLLAAQGEKAQAVHPSPREPEAAAPAPARPRARSPHRVQQRAVVLQPQQLVRRGHVVRNGLLPVVEERVWRPDFAGKEVVEWEALHGPLKPKPFILPALAEKHVDGVFLTRDGKLVRPGWKPRGPRVFRRFRPTPYHFGIRHRAKAGDVDVGPHLRDPLCNTNTHTHTGCSVCIDCARATSTHLCSRPVTSLGDQSFATRKLL